MSSRARGLRFVGLAAWVTMGAACATTSGVARPEPFPGVSPAPRTSSARPAPPPAAADPRRTPLAPPPLPGSADRGLMGRLDAVLKTALSLQGTSYRLGGETPASGFDCSGFVRYVFEQHHIDIPRTVAEQVQIGRKIPLADLREGDLLFFATTAKGPTHVGIALGPASLGEFVHAPGSGGAVRVEHFDTSYWRTKLVEVRRVL